MAKIKVLLNGPMKNGQSVTFKAPCDCVNVDGLRISHLTYNGSEYVENTTSFTFKDALGNDLTGIGNLFAAGAIVKVILDVDNRHAYLQNAGTNGYIESIKPKIHVLDGTQAGTLQDGEYCATKSLNLTYDNNTGLVVIRLSAKTNKSMSGGWKFIAAKINPKFAPSTHVAVTVTTSMSDPCNACGLLYSATDSEAGVIRFCSPSGSISSGYYVYGATSYYVAPGLMG